MDVLPDVIPDVGFLQFKVIIKAVEVEVAGLFGTFQIIVRDLEIVFPPHLLLLEPVEEGLFEGGGSFLSCWTKLLESETNGM